MQTVSAEWRNNQRAYIRNKGYPSITIDGEALSLDDISETRHSRSYDPMGMELPVNSLEIDLFNYNDRFLDMYKNYKNERKKIVLRYSYDLPSGTETILGGTFWLNSMELNDKILTISAESSLGLLSSEISVSESSINRTPHDVWSGSSEYEDPVEIDDFNYEIKTYSFGDLLQNISSSTGLSISYNLRVSNLNTSIYYAYSDTALAILQYIANASLARMIIDRNDRVVFSDSASSVKTSDDILLMNTMEEPVLSMSKFLKSVRTTSTVFDYDTSAEETQSVSLVASTSGGEYTTYTRYFECDFTSKKMVLAEISVDPNRVPGGSKRHKITKIQEGEFSYWVSGDTEVDNEYVTTTGYAVTYTRNRRNPFELTVKFAPFTTEVTDEITYNSEGEICDINNPFGDVINKQKISKYFDNREIYEMYIRGNPARDVGDYVMLSLKDDNDFDTYKPALVISSEIIYDGTFKENLTVRVIDTQFETSSISSGTQKLSDYMHTQLKDDTHTELKGYIHG